MRSGITPQQIKALKDENSGTPAHEAVIVEIRQQLQAINDEGHYKAQIALLIHGLTDSAVLDKTYVGRFLILAKIYCDANLTLKKTILNCVERFLILVDLENRLSTWMKLLEEKPFFQLMTDAFFDSDRHRHRVLMDEFVSVVNRSGSASLRENMWRKSWRDFDDLFQQQMKHSRSFAECILKQLDNLLRRFGFYSRHNEHYYDHRKFLSQFDIKSNLLRLITACAAPDQKDEKSSNAVEFPLIEITLRDMNEFRYLRQSDFRITVDEICLWVPFPKITKVMNALATQDVYLWSGNDMSYETYLKKARDEKYEGLSDQLMMRLARHDVSLLGVLLTPPIRQAVMESHYFSEKVILFYIDKPSWGASHVEKLKLLTAVDKIRLLNFIFSDYFYSNHFNKIVGEIEIFSVFVGFVDSVITQPDLSQFSNGTLMRLWQKTDAMPRVAKRFKDDAALTARALAAIGVVVSGELVTQHAQMQQALAAAQADTKVAQEELTKMRAELEALKKEKIELMQQPSRARSPILFFNAIHDTPRDVRHDHADASSIAVCDEKSDSEDDDGQELQAKTSKCAAAAGDCDLDLPSPEDDNPAVATQNNTA